MTQHSRPGPVVRLNSRYADLVALERGDPSELDLVFEGGGPAPRKATGAPANALVVGANGFIGAHLIYRLLCDDAVGRVYAVARGRGGKGAQARVLEAIARWGLSLSAAQLARLTVLSGAPYAARMGLNEASWAGLADDVDLVFQAASSTDYSAPYLELRKRWVLGLLEVMALCAAGRGKHLSWLGSTITHLYSRPEDFERPDSWWYSGYAQMKWVNERLLERAAQAGLSTTICQTPYVLGSTRLGVDPGLHYSFWRAVQVSRDLGLVREGEGMSFVPVDILCDALVVNALGSPEALLRPCNPKPWRTELLAELLDLPAVSWPDMRAQIVAHLPPVSQVLAPEDAPEIIARTNQPPLYPPGYDLSAFPQTRALMVMYLDRLGMTPQAGPRWAPQAAAPAPCEVAL